MVQGELVTTRSGVGGEIPLTFGNNGLDFVAFSSFPRDLGAGFLYFLSESGLFRQGRAGQGSARTFRASQLAT
jgi:hypothetical protein